MMNRALWKLIQLRLWGGMRLRLRRIGTGRGLVYLLTAILVMVVCLGQPLLAGDRLPSDASKFSGELLALIIAGTCILTIMTSSEAAVYFNPAEMHFLFGGPFTRRSLLLYKFFMYGVGAIISASVVSLLLPRFAGGRAAAFAGTLTTLMFIQLLTAVAWMASQKFTGLLSRIIRHATLLMLSGAVFVQILQLLDSNSFGRFILFLSRPVAVCLSPFEVFAQTFQAADLSRLLAWGSAAVGIDLCLLGLLLWWDLDYYERVEKVSSRLHNRWRQARQTGLWNAAPGRVTWRVPKLYRLAGFGPLFWRQLTTAVRSSSRTLALMSVFAIGVGFLFGVADDKIVSVSTKYGLVVSLVIFLLPRSVPFDFRSDWKHIDLLKTLPLRSGIVAAAELATPVLLMTILQVIALTTAVLVTEFTWRTLFSCTVWLVPFNLLVLSSDNLFFLLFPVPLIPVGRMDFEFFGRSLIEVVLKSILVATALLTALFVGWMASLLAGGSRPMFYLSTWLCFAALAVLAVFCVGWAFRRFEEHERAE